MYLKKPRRWLFEVYQKEQRQTKNVVMDLLGDLHRASTVVLWENGSFGPTFYKSCSRTKQKVTLIIKSSFSTSYSIG